MMFELPVLAVLFGPPIEECAAALVGSNFHVQLIFRVIFALLEMVAASGLSGGVVLNATKKKDSESRANVAGFGSVSCVMC